MLERELCGALGRPLLKRRLVLRREREDASESILRLERGPLARKGCVRVFVKTLHELHESWKRPRDELAPPLLAHLVVLVAQRATEAVCRASVFCRCRVRMGIHICTLATMSRRSPMNMHKSIRFLCFRSRLSGL